MTDDGPINPFVVLDQGGSFDDFVEAVGEQMETFIFNYVGSEADWLRMRSALLKLIEKQDADWDFVAEHREEIEDE